VSRILLLADVHANLIALEAVLAAAGPIDGIWVMGDTVGYGPDPSDVLGLLRERGAVMVAGNHDLAVATGEGLDLFNPVAAAAARLHRSWLSAAERDLLASLPLTRNGDTDAPLARLPFTLCHGSLRDPIWEYVFSGAQADATLRLATTTHCCNGHTHVPALYREGGRASRAAPALDVPIALTGRCLVNPGSVGQPRDGDARASYALLDSDGATVTFRRAPYDVHRTQRQIRARGLPPFLADRLALGY
jgi:diadenosine tetraphosphatase ApaH/serine/threonine PP2A family protein phosphatase